VESAQSVEPRDHGFSLSLSAQRNREKPTAVSKGFYKKNDQKSKTDFFSICFISHFWAFLGDASLKNTRKRDKTEKFEGKLTSKFWSISLENVFDMDFLQKYLYGVVELRSRSDSARDGSCADFCVWCVQVYMYMCVSVRSRPRVIARSPIMGGELCGIQR
jgi:hypothetical protein